MTGFTNRSNAARAARKLIADGDSPSNTFKIKPGADGRFEIDWIGDLTDGAPADPPAAATTSAVETLPAEVMAEIDAEVARYRQKKIDRAHAKLQRARKPRQRNASAGRVRKANAVDEAAACGIMPDKPVIASPTNQHYQKRLDRLAELAAEGKWDEIAAYAVNGANTYAQMVARYRDQLVTAHAAQQAEPAAGSQ